MPSVTKKNFKDMKRIQNIVESICPMMNMKFCTFAETHIIASRVKVMAVKESNVEDMRFMSEWIDNNWTKH